jgi:protein O-GlcNAc transferase
MVQVDRDISGSDPKKQMMSQAHLAQKFQLASQEHSSGRWTEAEQLYREVLAIKPDHAEALHALGILAMQTRRTEAAVQLLRGSAEIHPRIPSVWNDLAVALATLREFEQAATACRRAIQYDSAHAEAHFNLGHALKKLGQPAAAITEFTTTTQLKRDYAPAYTELGNTLGEIGRLEDAVAAHGRAVALDPNSATAHNHFSVALRGVGQFAAAAAEARRAIELQADFADAYSNLGFALSDNGQLDEGISPLQRAIELQPLLPEHYYNLGQALRRNQQFDQAAASYRRAIELRPLHPDACFSLGNVLQDQGYLDQAIDAYRAAAAAAPPGSMMQSTCHSNVLFSLPFHPDYDQAKILAECRVWNQRYVEPLRIHIRAHENDRDPNRRLRIGYVSPDFREHCQMLFTLPLLAQHDHERFEIVCYSGVTRPDAMTSRLRSHSDLWRSTVDQSDQQVAEIIRSDRIDILIDLTMHMAFGRPGVFARKPAPVQVSWLAYPGTTGLTSIDYRLTDPHLDPPGVGDENYSEKSIRLPETFWCYDALSEAPVNELPAHIAKTITFGCLNNLCKVNEEVIQLWTEVLKEVPGSCLLLMCHVDARAQMLEKFQRRGLSPDRIRFVPYQPREKYLRTYHRIDIVLDTFPSNGHTTSLDALWMGVPVISLVVKTVVGRAGLSQLTNLGLMELIAHQPQDYLRIARELAGDLGRLAELRRTLRHRMMQSPLMDAQRFALNIEATYRTMWKTWCDSR